MMNFQVISLIERDAYSLLRRLIMWKFVSSACMCKNTVMTALNLIQSKSAVYFFKVKRSFSLRAIELAVFWPNLDAYCMTFVCMLLKKYYQRGI